MSSYINRPATYTKDPAAALLGNEKAGMGLNFAADRCIVVDPSNANNNFLGSTTELISKGTLSFVRASGGTYYNRIGLMSVAGNNIPRLQNDPSSYSSISNSPNVLNNGYKSFTTNKAYNFAAGDYVTITASPTADYMNARVLAYNSSTGLLEVDVFWCSAPGNSSINWVVIKCLGLLSERQVTNLFTFSENFANNTVWLKPGMLSYNQGITSPRNDTTATAMIESTATSHYFLGQMDFIAGQNYNISIFAKVMPGSAKRYIVLMVPNNAFGSYYFVKFDPTDGSIKESSSTNINAKKSTYVSRGWWRFEVAVTATTTISSYMRFNLTSDTGDIYGNYTGDGTSGLYLWGAQAETYDATTTNYNASSYIQTNGSQVTRSAEGIQITNFTSKLPTYVNGFTAVSEFTPAGFSQPLQASLAFFGDANNRTGITTTLNNAVYAVTSGTTVQIGATPIVANTINKVAWTMSANYAKSAINGSLLPFSSPFTMPNTLVTIEIGSRYGGSNAQVPIQGVAYIPKVSADAELIARTT